MTRATTSELRILRNELLDAHRELVRLRGQTEQLIASNHELSGLLATSSHRTGELLKIIVAFRRLLEASDANAALTSVEEILSNIIGTEDFAVLIVTEETVMRVVAGMGPAVEAGTLRMTLADLDDFNRQVVPLYIGSRLVGAIVIRALLPQRNPLNADDDQVLSLLSKFGASAVMAADHRRSWTRLEVPALV